MESCPDKADSQTTERSARQGSDLGLCVQGCWLHFADMPQLQGDQRHFWSHQQRLCQLLKYFLEHVIPGYEIVEAADWAGGVHFTVNVFFIHCIYCFLFLCIYLPHLLQGPDAEKLGGDVSTVNLCIMPGC